MDSLNWENGAERPEFVTRGNCLMKKFLLRRIGVADDRSSARPTLHDCLEVVLLQADTLMGDVLEGLAASTKDTKRKSTFGAHSPVNTTAIDLLCSQASAVKQTFMAQLRLSVYHSGAQDSAAQPLVRFEDLQLLDSKQIDASIELSLAQQEVSRCVDDVLPSLNALISSLLGWITVQSQLNPLKPDAFVRALQACLVQHVPDEQMRAALITPAAGLLGVSLRQLYREVCDWLRSQGVEPATPVGTAIGGGGAARGTGAENSIGRTMLTLDKLRKLLSGELGRGSGRQDFLNTVPASYVALEDMKLLEPMMRRLAQRANLPVNAAVAVDASGQQIMREPTQGRQLGRQLGEEVVLMMLDNLMLDERLLPKVRELIKMLEPVLLAFVQSDPRFFSERQHPARQFLDRITHRSLGYKSENDEGFSRFLKSISDAVGILTDGDGEAAAFARLMRDLEAGWIRDAAAQGEQHGEATYALMHAEQKNLLAQRLAVDFHERQKNKDIPEVVANFLRGPWAQVVAQAQLDCADGSADPGAYLALVDDLLWSVQLRRARRNRARLAQLMPNLLVKLRQGLQLIQYPEERIPVFFDALISLHEKVFEGHRGASVAEPADQTQQENIEVMAVVGPPEASDSTEFWVADEGVQEAAYLAEEAESPMEAVQHPWSVADLSTGAWVELMVEGVWLRAQLTWVSPHRTLFMFVSHGGLAHSMSRRTMARLRMLGRVRFVSDGHLVDNALDAVAQTALKNDLGQVSQQP